MTYKFIFKKEGYKSETIYEVKRTYHDDYSSNLVFHDATCLLDFGIFDSVQMFDDTGKEYVELY